MDESFPGSTSRHVEVERKFEVSASTRAPSFAEHTEIDHVTRRPSETLHAIYYDTAEHLLAAHHITLRRRTGGGDSGWHLKLPEGNFGRTEIRVEFAGDDDEEVPAALRDIVDALVQDRPLAAVARITNRRTVDVLYGRDGAALAEFCDDHVVASAEGQSTEQRWREWELELVEDAVRGGAADEALLARLSETLFSAGATPAKHASKLARAIGRS